MGITVSILGTKAGWHLHVHVVSDGRLRLRQYKIHLLSVPDVEGDQHKEQLYGHLSDDMCVRFEIIHGIFLFPSVDVELGLVFLYLARIGVTFASHCPHRGQDFRVL